MTATLERIDKARRLLIEGRLNVVSRGGDVILAKCRGDSGEVYDLGYDWHQSAGRVGWFCTCPAKGTCAHIKALMLVTVRRG